MFLMKVRINTNNQIDVNLNSNDMNINLSNVLRTPVVYDKNYVFQQNQALDKWVINHNMNKYPAVSVIDSAGNEVIGDIEYIDENNLIIKFSGGFSGKATLN